LKTYRSARDLLSEVKRALAASKPSFQRSPLDDVIELICRGRHYTWMGIYLAVGPSRPPQLLGAGGDAHLGQMALPETRSKILVPIKLGGRQLGIVDVESDRENAFGVEGRVLLEDVATVLARFLSGPGKYLVRKARKIEAAAPDSKPQGRASQPSATTIRSAAVGEK
jgi:hypothetical protein